MPSKLQGEVTFYKRIKIKYYSNRFFLKNNNNEKVLQVIILIEKILYWNVERINDYENPTGW